MELPKYSCGLSGNLRLQYKDADFGTFVNLTSTAEIKDLTVVKDLDSTSSMKFLEPVDFSSSDNPLIIKDNESLLSTFTMSGHTIPLSTECQLERDNAENIKSQTMLTPSSKMPSDILEKVAEKIYTYKAYPIDSDFSVVAEALTQTHPCLSEPGSFNKSYLSISVLIMPSQQRPLRVQEKLRLTIIHRSQVVQKVQKKREHFF